jgi:hypothetical protein
MRPVLRRRLVQLKQIKHLSEDLWVVVSNFYSLFDKLRVLRGSLDSRSCDIGSLLLGYRLTAEILVH